MALNPASIIASLSSGGDGPSSLLSGFRDSFSGGITVGSKVIGSGSAATSVPPVVGSPPSGNTTVSAGAPSWLNSPLLPIALVAAGLIALLLFGRRGRR
jgi:hypothetical protein